MKNNKNKSSFCKIDLFTIPDLPVLLKKTSFVQQISTLTEEVL